MDLNNYLFLYGFGFVFVFFYCFVKLDLKFLKVYLYFIVKKIFILNFFVYLINYEYEL